MSISLSAYLVTDGNGAEAVEFYKDALGAEVLMSQTFGEAPSNPDYPTPEEAKNRIMHAHLKVGSSDLMLSDTFPGMPHVKGNHVTISINVTDASEAKTIFNKLQQGGEVGMPLQETFWSPAYGQVTDKYGVTFHVSTAGQ
ncbi:VOC family protein [Paenibacillus sp. GCM10023252]|uniref:VOC family protein n=1 Tax=Paenibacillus sp. GCM10023252 TaxID=3252649 RepID=UPI0036144FF0